MDYQLTSELIGGITTLALVTGIGISRSRSSKANAALSAEKYSKLKAEFDSLTKDNETFTEALALAKDAVGSLEQQLSEARKGQDDLGNQLEAKKQLETQLDEQKQRVSLLQNELDTLGKTKAQTIEVLTTEKAAYEAKASTLTQQVAELTEQKKALQKVLDEQSAEKGKQQSARKLLSDRIFTLEKERDALVDAQQQAQKQAKETEDSSSAALDETLSALKRELGRSQQNAESAEATVAGLEKKVQGLQSDKAALEEAMKISQQAIAALQQQLAAATESKAKTPQAQKMPAKSQQASKVTGEPKKATSVEATSAGEKNAISGKSFVITGKLTQVTNEQLTAAIKESGGQINKMPSAKTDYIVVGENPGNKLVKAEKCKVTQLSEEQMLALLEAG
ncbi:MAG: BRCT domain-containing protein [Cyanobacteria bacterium J06597_16]